MIMKKATHKYVVIKSFPHYGSVVVPTGKISTDGEETQAECMVVYSETLPVMPQPRKVWIKRTDI